MNVKNSRMRRLEEPLASPVTGTMIGPTISDAFNLLGLFFPVPGHSQSNKACCFLQIESLLLYRASFPAYSSSLRLTGFTVLVSDGTTLKGFHDLCVRFISSELHLSNFGE
jgi:hypothetical protein